jgi:hypothetical protein
MRDAIPPFPRAVDSELRQAVSTLSAQVSEIHSSWGGLLAAVSRIENRQDEHERRIVRLEGAMERQREIKEQIVKHGLDEFRSPTGNHFVLTVEQAQEQQLKAREDARAEARAELARAQLESDAGVWRWTKTALGKIVVHVLTGVGGAVVVYVWHVLSTARP